MSFVLKDRVKETTTVVGTGPATLLGSPARFIPFSNIGDTNTTFYCIAHQTLNEWEVGLGTYSLGANTLTRNTVKASSSANVAVTFSAGTKDIFCCYTAEDALWVNGPLGTPLSGNLVNCSGYPATLQTDKIISIAAITDSNSITVYLDPTTLEFRSSLLYVGAPNLRTIASQLSLLVPAGVGLGLVANQQARLLIIAMDNSGTVELAIANANSSINFDETTLLTTDAFTITGTSTASTIAVTTGLLTVGGTVTGTFKPGMMLVGTNVPAGTYIISNGTGSGGAGTYFTNCYTAVASTSISGVAGYGVFSNPARTNLPFRVVGFIDITETTAGNWAIDASTKQGSGGLAVSALNSLGYSQSYKVLTPVRVSATTYYNTTGAPIYVTVSTGNVAFSIMVDDIIVGSGSGLASLQVVIVPNKSSYKFTTTVTTWVELR